MSTERNWPAWYYGPAGAAAIFTSAAEVPSGWQDHPEKVGKADPSKRQTGSASLNPAPATDLDRAGESGTKPATTPSTDADVDAAGWPFDVSLHAATKTKTKDGLWRMKVGVSRPAAKKADFNL